MKSNFTERFNDVFEKYKNLGVFNIDDMVTEMMDGFYIITEKKREKDRYILKNRLEAVLSQNECFSYAKNMHVMLDDASLDNLKNIDESMMTDIASREATLEVVRKKEREKIDGQMAFETNGVNFTGYKEETLLSKMLEGRRE